jgi:hypothetical protein
MTSIFNALAAAELRHTTAGGRTKIINEQPPEEPPDYHPDTLGRLGFGTATLIT